MSSIIVIDKSPYFKITNVGEFLSNVASLLIILAFFLTFFSLILGGLQWIVSGGEKEKVTAARNRLIHALLGLVIVMASWSLMQLTGQFFGIDPFNLTLPTLAPQ